MPDEQSRAPRQAGLPRGPPKIRRCRTTRSHGGIADVDGDSGDVYKPSSMDTRRCFSFEDNISKGLRTMLEVDKAAAQDARKVTQVLIVARVSVEGGMLWLGRRHVQGSCSSVAGHCRVASTNYNYCAPYVQMYLYAHCEVQPMWRCATYLANGLDKCQSFALIGSTTFCYRVWLCMCLDVKEAP